MIKAGGNNSSSHRVYVAQCIFYDSMYWAAAYIPIPLQQGSFARPAVKTLMLEASPIIR